MFTVFFCALTDHIRTNVAHTAPLSGIVSGLAGSAVGLDQMLVLLIPSGEIELANILDDQMYMAIWFQTAKRVRTQRSCDELVKARRIRDEWREGDNNHRRIGMQPRKRVHRHGYGFLGHSDWNV